MTPSGREVKEQRGRTRTVDEREAIDYLRERGFIVLTVEGAERVRCELLALYGYQGPSGPAITRLATNAALALLGDTDE